MTVHSDHRSFKLLTKPREHGWYRFKIAGNKAIAFEDADPDFGLIKNRETGYLVGDRLIADDVTATSLSVPDDLIQRSERVYIIPDSLDRFSRVQAGRIYPEGSLVFLDQAFPLGPESAVLDAYVDNKDTVGDILGVTPALDLAFRTEVYRREQAELRRIELEQKMERDERERRQRELLDRLGDGVGRRTMAREDFGQAAKAALSVGNAEYLDHREIRRGEWAVKYRVDGQRLECICDIDLHIVDAGICLTDHRTNEKGDGYFTLESLPSVVREATRRGKLVIWRHV